MSVYTGIVSIEGQVRFIDFEADDMDDAYLRLREEIPEDVEYKVIDVTENYEEY